MRLSRPLILLGILLTSPGMLLAQETTLAVRWELSPAYGGSHEALFTNKTGTFKSWLDYGNGVLVTFESPSAYWYLRFSSADRSRLSTGLYADAAQHHAVAARLGDMSVSGWGPTCPTTRPEWFDVKQIEYSAGGEATSFRILFEIPCIYGEGSVMGDLRYEAIVPVGLTAPLARAVQKLDSLSFDIRATSLDQTPPLLTAVDLPPGAQFTDHGDGSGTFTWQTGFSQVGVHRASFEASDASGFIDRLNTAVFVTQVTSLLLESEIGDWVGQGEEMYFVPLYSGVSNNHLGGLSVFFPHFRGYHLEFSAPFAQPLSVGSYPNAGRFPIQPPDQAGMRVAGDHRECAGGARNFKIKEVSYGTNGAERSLWATFDQRCEGYPGALKGELRVNADVPVLLRAPWQRALKEGEDLEYTIRAADRIESIFSIEATKLPPGATFTDHGDNTGTLSWMPYYGQAGDYKAGFSAVNGAGDVERAYTAIRVNLLNDDIDDATSIETLPSLDDRNLSLATSALDDPACEDPWAPLLGWTVWYKFTPSNDLPIFVRTASATNSGTFSIFTGSRGALEEVVCGAGSPFFFEASADRTYFIMLGSPGAPESTQIKVDVAPPLEVKMEARDATLLSSARDSALVTGTIECSRASTVYAWVNLERRIAHREVRGGSYLQIDCDGQGEWSAEVRVDEGELLPGGTCAYTYAVAIDDETGRYAVVEQEEFLVLRP